ncbi:MAG: flagellar hook-associated protein FlgL [Methylococcaceae bacterium]
MRISTAWAQQLNIDAMSSQQTKLSKVQQQLSTGLKMTAPADDPAAAARVLDLESSIAKTNQYQTNIATARGRLSLEESALEASGNLLDRAKELTMQGMNDSQNSTDRLSIKFEVDQLIQQLAATANTQNANGEFIFSGGLSKVPAFTTNPTTGEYVYQGSTQQRAVQISPTRQVADGDLGFNVFENVNSSSPAADENGKRSIFNTLKALSDGLGATFNASPAEITGDRFLRYGLDYSAAAAQFDLVAGGVTAPIDLTGQKFAGVEDIVSEINNQLTAGGFNTDIQARSNGNNLEFVSVATGAASSIQINNTSGTFLTDAGFSNGQTKAGVDLPAAPANVFQSQLTDVLKDLDAARNSILEARSSVGVRLNVLDDQESQNEKLVLDTQTMLSDTQDLDYADAISRYQLQSTALQAAQQTFSTIKKLSLFNYL